MSLLSATVLLCTVISTLEAVPTVGVCDNELIENDSTNYFATSDCTKYKHCYTGVSGRPMGEIMSCSFPTYWNQDLLTCTSMLRVYCPVDYCLSEADGTQRPGAGSCRGYWRCFGRTSMPQCCPHGQMFDNVTNVCVPEDPDALGTCDQTCVTDKPDASAAKSTTTGVPPVCNRRAVPGNPSVYLAFLPNQNMEQMPCPPGTVFSAAVCNCIDDGIENPGSRIPCRPDLLLSFDTDATDESPRPIFVGKNDVTVRNGAGIFNGINSSLNLQRFSNLEHMSTIIIEMTYSSDHSQLVGAQSLVSNDNCDPFKPSINIKEDRNNVYFTIGAVDENGNLSDKEVTIPQTGSVVKKIEYTFTNGVLRVSLNGVTRAVAAPGFLQNVHCGLNIGTSKQASFFNGSIDFLQIHLCVPGTYV